MAAAAGESRAEPIESTRDRRWPLWERLVLGTWFAAFAVLATLFPRTGDDWAWGVHEGIARLRDFFQHLNGRYAGNLLAVVLVRSRPTAVLVVAAVLCATLFLVLHLARNRTPLGYGLTSLLFLTMPLGTWREAVVWLSGFVNYAFAGIVFLAFLAVAQAEWFGRMSGPTPLRLGGIAVLAFVGQLFMENVTIAICAMGVGTTVAVRIVQRRWGAYTLTWTIASLVGAVVMLINPVYHTVASGDQSLYQSTQSFSGKHALHDVAVKVLDTMSTEAVVLNYVLNASLLVLVVVYVLATRQARTIKGAVTIGSTFASVALSWGLWLVERHHVPSVRVRALAAVAAALLVVAVLVLATLVRSDRRWTLVMAVVSAVVVVGPLAVVNPVGPRSFYPSYLLLIVVVTALAAEVREAVAAFGTRLVWAPLHVASAGLALFFVFVFVSVHSAIDDRLAHVRSAAASGAAAVTIAPLPWPYYVHNGDPFFSILSYRFKLYYHLPPSLVVKLEPNPWLRVPGKPKPLPAP